MRDRERQRIAEGYGETSWDALSRAQRDRALRESPLLQHWTEMVSDAGREKADAYTLFWDRVNLAREPYQERMQELRRLLSQGLISGNQYREEIQYLERRMAEIPYDLKRFPEFEDVPYSQEEWDALYGAMPSPHPVDQFIDAWYQTSRLAEDPRTGMVDVALMMDMRRELQTQWPQEIVSEAMSYINRNRDPRYVQAQQLYQEYMTIPRYLWLSNIEADEARAAKQRITLIRESFILPGFQKLTERQAVLLYFLMTNDAKGAVLSMIPLRRNPDRTAFWEDNPLLAMYYSDETWAELAAEYGPLEQMFPEPSETELWQASMPGSLPPSGAEGAGEDTPAATWARNLLAGM
jgi:hypothetical protein